MVDMPYNGDWCLEGAEGGVLRMHKGVPWFMNVTCTEVGVQELNNFYDYLFECKLHKFHNYYVWIKCSDLI